MDTRTGEIFRSDEPMDEEKLKRMAEAERDGYLVEVSERVADLMGQAKRRDEKKARKAVKAARKANRR